jgi:phage shock protein PspC (stress-responsive transcriptional regulator)
LIGHAFFLRIAICLSGTLQYIVNIFRVTLYVIQSLAMQRTEGNKKNKQEE